MANATPNVISALRHTAENLASSNTYQWGHMGACNCGFLAQEVTHLQKREIHRSAMTGHGDWSEQLNDYCATSGLPMDNIISEMTQFGFELKDLIHLERLSDPLIRARLSTKSIRYNHKHDVINYLRAWADMLEEKLVGKISLNQLFSREEHVLKQE